MIRTTILSMIPFLTMFYFFISNQIPSPVEGVLLLVIMVLNIMMIFISIDFDKMEKGRK